MLRAMGTGGVPLINPDVEISPHQLESWSCEWGKLVQSWATKFVAENTAGFSRLAESWGAHVLECKRENILQIEEEKMESEKKRKKLESAIETMNYM